MAQSRSPPPPFPTTEISSEVRKTQKQADEQEQQPAASIPEGPIVEILSRVPYRSLCRFKCVSKPWLALCSDPGIRKRSPQTLTGFFHLGVGSRFQFCNLSGRGPPMVDPYLPFLCKSYEYDLVSPEHCCGGLILLRCWKSGEDGYYLVVCNPATEKWTELPPCPIESPRKAEQYLGFDPAIPSRFVVFAQLWEFIGVAIYSSDTGRWTTVVSGWNKEPYPIGHLECVFLNGTMHLMTAEPSIVTVDTEGKVWREIDIPGNMPENYQYFSIGQSQGHLYAWCIDDPNVCQLFVWALEDYGTATWTLKHTVSILELFGRNSRKHGKSYQMLAIHPDRDLIFLTDRNEKTISYDMDNREVQVICSSLALFCAQPYIPCFAELPSNGH